MVFSTNKTDRDDITKILLKVALNTMTISYPSNDTEKDPLFVQEHNTVLSRNYFISKLKGLLSYLGFVYCDNSGHALRIGAATTYPRPYDVNIRKMEIKLLYEIHWTSDRDLHSFCTKDDVPLTIRSIYILFTVVYIFSGVPLLASLLLLC